MQNINLKTLSAPTMPQLWGPSAPPDRPAHRAVFVQQWYHGAATPEGEGQDLQDFFKPYVISRAFA